MSHGYRLIQWTPYKKRYDLAVVGIIATFLATFFVIGKLRWRGQHSISDEVLLIRALGTCAFAMLSFILCIGPLARIDRKILPVLYNRRHLGVTTFFVAAAHAIIVLGYYHGFGVIGPVRSLFTSNTQYGSISGFPFEILGLTALLILFLMAATSHDFWLNKLSPGLWKRLHMMVYVAWTLLVFHIVLGALQSEKNPIYIVVLTGVVVTVVGLHLVAGWREVKFDRDAKDDQWIEIGPAEEIPDKRAKVVAFKNRERVAIFRQGEDLGRRKCLRASGRPAWRRQDHRRMHHLSMAWLSISPRNRLLAAAVYGEVPTYPVKIENGRVWVCMEANHVGG